MKSNTQKNIKDNMIKNCFRRLILISSFPVETLNPSFLAAEPMGVAQMFLKHRFSWQPSDVRLSIMGWVKAQRQRWREGRYTRPAKGLRH